MLALLGVGTQGQRLLDLGTGTGLVAREFARRGCAVSGTDIAPGQIDVERLHREFRFRVDDPDGSREVRFGIANTAFGGGGRLLMQDGPDVCYQKLLQTIAAGESGSPGVVAIDDADLARYREAHTHVAKRRARPAVPPSTPQPPRPPYVPRVHARTASPQPVAPPPVPEALAPGLDAAADRDVLDLAVSGSFKKTGGAFAGVTMIDAVAEFGGRLYLFDDVGCIVSNASVPSKEDFTPCSPAASAAYDQTRSVEPPRAYDLEPRQRAWPQVAAWRGRLYAIRNTYDGPQLWACDPGLGLDPAICEPGDWSLVAGDAADLTRFGQDTADAASLLVATPTHLWVGLDDPVRGVHVFRTAADRPGLASDFTGRSGCTAGTAGCEGFGGDGFGSPSVLARIFDAKAVSTADGATDLVLTAGDGSAPVRVVLLSD